MINMMHRAENNTRLFMERGLYSIWIQLNDDNDIDCRFASMNSPPDANIGEFFSKFEIN